jgi:hypothetical protein
MQLGSAGKDIVCEDASRECKRVATLRPEAADGAMAAQSLDLEGCPSHAR